MKRILIPLVLSCLATVSVRATVIWTENWSYANGNLTNVSAGVWTNFSGSGRNDMVVTNNQLEVAASSSTGVGALNRADDDCRGFAAWGDTTYNTPTVVYVSFPVTCTNLPNAAGTYFASFYSLANGFYGRIFAQTTGTVVPNTWRLGVSAHGSAPTVYPVDLATNVTYQVVVEWDPVTQRSLYLWVNPIGSTDGSSVNSTDTYTDPTMAANTFAFRQATGSGSYFFRIGTLIAGTTFSDVSPDATATAPSIVIQPVNTTNIIGNNVSLFAAANGQSLKAVTYQWQRSDSSAPGTYTNIPVSVNATATSNVLTVAAAQISDTAQYRLVATNPNNTALTATSSPAWIAIFTSIDPPAISVQPTNTAAYYGQNVNLSVTANGVAPLTYTWYYNTLSNYGGCLIDGGSCGATCTGIGTETLTIGNLGAGNGTVGYYWCNILGSNGKATNTAIVQVSARAPVVISIGDLRGMVDANLAPTNTTIYYEVTGIVISKTNYTSTTSSSFFIQDATGGIDVFVGGGLGGVGGTAPAAGDSVTVTGPLGAFGGMLELNLSASNAGHTVVTNSHGNLLPPGQVLPLWFTNSPAYGGISNAYRLYQGSLITYTNVHFLAADGSAKFAGNTTYTLADSSGNTGVMYVYYGFPEIVGQVIPQGNIWRLTGPMSFFGGPAPAGYQIEPSTMDDIVTTPPPAVNAAIAKSGGHPALTWTAQPFMSYTVLRSATLSPNRADYLPVASGLTFNTTAGLFYDLSDPAPAFYMVISP